MEEVDVLDQVHVFDEQGLAFGKEVEKLDAQVFDVPVDFGIKANQVFVLFVSLSLKNLREVNDSEVGVKLSQILKVAELLEEDDDWV